MHFHSFPFTYHSFTDLLLIWNKIYVWELRHSSSLLLLIYSAFIINIYIHILASSLWCKLKLFVIFSKRNIKYTILHSSQPSLLFPKLSSVYEYALYALCNGNLRLFVRLFHVYTTLLDGMIWSFDVNYMNWEYE